MEYNLTDIFQWVLIAMFMKSIFIGSSFSFVKWLKYGSEYTTWFNEIQNKKFIPKGK